MNDTKMLNLESLHKTFFRADARRGKRLLKDLSNRGARDEAHHLLRHHDESRITDEETWDRDSVDYLLSYYSVLEIAITAGVIEEAFEHRFFEEALTMLNFEPLRLYYTKHYRLALPFRLLARNLAWTTRDSQSYLSTLSRVFPVPAPLESASDLSTSFRIFSTFIPLTSRFEKDEDLSSFLWLLDGGTIEDVEPQKKKEWDYAALLAQLRHARHSAILISERRNRPANRVLRGTAKFLQFCIEIDSVLRVAEALPSVQAEMYLYYAYWFDASTNIVRKTDALWETLSAVGGKTEDLRLHIKSLSALGERVRASDSFVREHAENVYVRELSKLISQPRPKLLY